MSTCRLSHEARVLPRLATGWTSPQLLMTSEIFMRFLGSMLLLSGMAWAAVGDVPSLRVVPPPRPFAAAHQLNVASSASLEPGGRAGRHLMQPESCQFAPDAKPWCSEIPQHLCEEASDLGLVIRSHCATTCQICKAEASAQDKLLEMGETVVLRTGHLVLESSLTENGWTLWLEQSGALTEGFPVGNGRVKVNHTTIYVPAKPDCDAYYIAARRLIDEYKIQVAHITHHNCKTNLSMTYHEAGIVHMIQSGTPLVHNGGLYANKHAWYVHLDSNEYPRLFLMNMANKGYRKVAVVWWSGHDWASTSAQYITENYMSPYGLELVYNYSWAPEDGGNKASGDTDDGTYQELYNTTLWDQMLQEISDSGAEVLVVYSIAEGVSIMKRIKAMNLNFKGVYMTVSPSRPYWEEYLGNDGDLVITPAQWHSDIQSPCAVFGNAHNYGLEYEKRFGIPVDYDSASRTAAGLMIQHAIQTFNSIENMISGLQTMSVDTMFGRIKFSLSQRNIGRSPVGMQRQNSELELVLPEELALSSAIDMISWTCRPLLYDSNQDACSAEELEIYQQCRADHPSLVNLACEDAVLAQGAGGGVGRAAIAGTVVMVVVVVAVGLAMFVSSRYLSAWRFRIAFDELRFIDSDGSSHRDPSAEVAEAVLSSRESGQDGITGITWRGCKVVLLKICSDAGRGIHRVLKRSKSSMALPVKHGPSMALPPFGASRCFSENPGDAVAPRTLAAVGGQAHGTTLPWDPASLGALRHPNLVNVMGTTVAPVGGTNFLVVEAMPAGNMHEFMQNDLANVMTGAASFSAVMGIATGLQYLHESRPAIVHGDLRAEHVLLDEKLTAKVRIETHITAIASPRVRKAPSQMSIRDPPVTGTAPVTAGPATAWMAPELLTGGSTTTSSDIYALGVTIWEILTKATPYESLEVPSPKNLPPDTVAAIVNQGLRPAIPGDMADAVRALLERCWDQDPSRRPSIVAVADVLSAEKSAAPMVIARTNTQQSRSLLHQVLPPHVAAALEQGRKVEPEDFPSVTIFFSDIVGYTDMSSTMPPQKVMDMLDRLYARFDELTKKHELFKVETIGDAYMCVGGLPKAQPDHTLRIARFALEAVQAANQVMVDEEDPEKGSISIRVGFHSGAVVASVVGNLNPRYCLFGDTVNTASRMESNSEANRINLSPRAQKLLVSQCAEAGETAMFTPRGRIQIKGKGATECFFLESIDTQAGLANKDGNHHADEASCDADFMVARAS